MNLTRRQAQLLRLYSVGATDHDIAVELHIGIETVKEHGKALRDRLGARTRAECVAVGFQHRLLR